MSMHVCKYMWRERERDIYIYIYLKIVVGCEVEKYWVENASIYIGRRKRKLMDHSSF